jgi:hypothetical protein
VKVTGLSERIPALEWIERAREALAAAQTFEGVAELAEQARMAEALLECKKSGSHAHAEAWAFVAATTRKIGEMTLALPKAKRGPKREAEISPADVENQAAARESKTAALARASVPSARASEAEKVARLPDDEYRARVEAGKQQILDGKRPKALHAVTSGSDHDGNQFSTPAKYVEAARKVMGGIELDPATNPSAQLVVKADRFYTRDDDALTKSWAASSVWLNRPYSRELVSKFGGHLLAELAGIGTAITLVNSDHSAAWYQAELHACVAFCLLDHRIAFELDGKPVPGNAHAQTIMYWGPKLPLFSRTFAEFGPVCVVHKKRSAA